MAPTEDPVLRCAEMEKKNRDLADFSDKILSEPKPKPPTPPPKTEEKKPEAGAEAEAAQAA